MEDLNQTQLDESVKVVRVWEAPSLIPLDLTDAEAGAGFSSDGVGACS